MVSGMKLGLDHAIRMKLFVAGIPSGVDTRQVAKFFSQFGQFELLDHSGHIVGFQAASLSRGHMFLVCPDKAVADAMLAQRSFQFLGRTLTVTEYKSGQDLIAENQRLNKRRVILKKVPSYVAESDLRAELTKKCGPIHTLFQFKPVNSPDLSPSHAVEHPRFHVFSVVFKDLGAAKRLTKKGYFELSDGSKFFTEKFTKQRVNLNTNTGNQPIGYSSRQCPNPSRVVKKTIYQPHYPKHTRTDSCSIYDIKPSSSKYFKGLKGANAVIYPYDHASTNLRINHKTPHQGRISPAASFGAYFSTGTNSCSPTSIVSSLNATTKWFSNS